MHENHMRCKQTMTLFGTMIIKITVEGDPILRAMMYVVYVLPRIIHIYFFYYY